MAEQTPAATTAGRTAPLDPRASRADRIPGPPCLASLRFSPPSSARNTGAESPCSRARLSSARISLTCSAQARWTNSLPIAASARRSREWPRRARCSGPGVSPQAGGFGAEIGDQLDADKVLREFSDGSTLVLQGLHRTWEPLAAFTRQLITDIGHPIQVNAYITPASSRGFDPHYDVHDVFVIQIAGEKRWTIHEPVLPRSAQRRAVDRPSGRRGRTGETRARTSRRPSLRATCSTCRAAGSTRRPRSATTRSTSPSASRPTPAPNSPSG